MDTYKKRVPKRDREEINRIISLGEVTDESVNYIIELIYEINELDGKKNTESRNPIKLIINSSGGCVYSGFGLIDVIDASKTPIYTICHGQAFSMGFVIMIAGHKRFSTKSSTFMYHDLSTDPGHISVAGLRQELKECDRLQVLFDNYVISKTRLTKKILDPIKNQKIDWYIDAELALKHGIVNEII